MKAFQFKIQIKELQNPPIWRRILIPSKYTLHDFHLAIQAAFGWENYHLYHFSKFGWGSSLFYQLLDEEGENEDVEDSTKIKLQKVFTKPKQPFTYIYDFGDNWNHQIILEKILDENIIKPICIEGEGACPPEDSGGVPGYKSLITTLKNPTAEDYESIIEWLEIENGNLWDVNDFNIDAANARLLELF